MARYYFDTSIWLDFLEDRNEPNMPKSDWARQLVSKIISKDDRIVYSDVNLWELEEVGYSKFDIKGLLGALEPIPIFINAFPRQIRKVRELGSRRNIPRKDALHALVARDSKAILVALDNHFKKLKDIIVPVNPMDLI